MVIVLASSAHLHLAPDAADVELAHRAPDDSSTSDTRQVPRFTKMVNQWVGCRDD
jgi:hypothetical protein